MLPYVVGFVFVLITTILVVLLGLPWWIALIVAILVGLVLLGRFVYKKVVGKKSAGELERALMAQSSSLGARARPDQQNEIVALQREFQGAVESLKGSRLARGGTSALYALPWYAIIGPPGAGKSTAIRASGLTFPQSAKGSRSAIRGVGGTRNCEWWLTNEAVLLDTAGRYTTEADDRDEWFAFLDLLQKHRPGKPLNGVMVAVSITDVSVATDDQLSTLSDRIRERLDEIIGRLGVVVPVYLVFTKCDLMSGFTETFEEMRREERSQLLGFTLPAGRRGVDANELHTYFDRLLDSVGRAAFHRLGVERRLEARERIFVFPQELAATRSNVITFIERVFAENVYHDTPVFRGAYFTSGTQEGRPIDRVLSAMAGAFGSSAPSTHLSTSTEAKSYFLGDLFTRVMFPDAELAFGSNARERAKAMVRYVASAVATVLALVFAGLTVNSYLENRDLLLDVRNVVAPMAAVGPVNSPTIAVLRSLSPMRDRLSELRRYESEGAPWSMRLGLYRGETVLPLTRQLYVHSIRRSFVEPMVRDLARGMNDLIVRLEGSGDQMTPRDHARLYDDLREYLLLTEPRESRQPALDEELTNYLVQRLVGRWTATYVQNATPAQRTDVEGHVRAYLSLLGGDANLAVHRDAYLVRRARGLLGRMPPTQVAVDRIVTQMESLGWDVTLASIVGSTSTPLSSSARVRAAFTHRGWEEVVRPMLDENDASLLGDPWVVDAGTQARDTAGDRARRCAMRSEYYGRLIDEWKGFIGSLRIGDPSNSRESLAQLEQLTRGDPPPFARIMNAVAYHTALAEAPPSTTDRLAARAQTSVLDRIRRGMGSNTADAAENLVPDDPCAGGTYRHREDVVAALAGFYRFGVPESSGNDAGGGGGGGGGAITSIQIYHEQLEFLRDALRTYLDAPTSADALLSRVQQARTNVRALIEEQDVGWRSRFDALLWPPILAASSSSTAALAGARGTEWCSAVARPFGSTLRGRYPFDRDGQDAPLADFGAFYKPTGGILWSFYDTVLARDISRAGGRFSTTSSDGVGSAYGAPLITFLERSQAISDAMFPPGSGDPKVDFEVRIRPTPGVATTTLTIDGQRYEYRNGPEQWFAMHWPGEDQHGATLRIRGAAIEESFEQSGDWGFFRLLDAGVARANPSDRTLSVAYRVENQGVDVVIDVRAARTQNPFVVGASGRLFETFRGSGANAPRSIASGGSCSE